MGTCGRGCTVDAAVVHMKFREEWGSIGAMSAHLQQKARGEAGGDGRVYSHREILVILGVLVLSILLAALDQTIVSTALPTIAGELNGFDLISWLVTAYLLTQTIAMPIYGKLGDLFGRKMLLIYAVGIFLVGSALSGLSQSMWQLIAFRALQGLGAGGLMVTSFSVIGDVIPSRDRGKYLGYIMPIFGLATVFGPTLGGFFIDHFSWRWIFYVNIPIGIAAIAAAWWWLDIPSHKLGSKKLDYAGAILLSLLMSCIVLIATWGGGIYAWASIPILALGAAAVALALLFFWAEHRAHDPIIPLRIFKNQIVVGCMLLGITVGLSLFGTLTYLPTYLQIAKGASPTDSGLLMLPLSLGLFAAAVATGQIISRTGRYKPFPIIGTILAVLGTYLLSTITADTAMHLIYIYMTVLGAGIGMVMPVITQAAQNAVTPDMIGVATSGVNLARQLSGAIGVSVAGTLFTARIQEGLAAQLSPSQLSRVAASGTQIDPAAIASLPPAIHQTFEAVFGAVLPSIFLDFVPVILAGVVIAFFLKEIPLASQRSRS